MMIDKTIKVIKDINKIIDADFESLFQNATNAAGAEESNWVMHFEYDKIIRGFKIFENEYYIQQKYRKQNLEVFDN